MTKPLTLQEQLLMRVAKFQENFPDITQAEIARYCNIGESNFGAALAGRRGLSANSCLKLHTLLSLPRNEVIKKFSSEPTRSSKIVNFQRHGQSMRLDGNDGWISGRGVDPNDAGNGIDDTPDATQGDPTDEDLQVLRQVRSIHRKAARLISDFINQAKINRQGSTPPTAQKFNRSR